MYERYYIQISIIIITLFQEDNIFGMDASLTYGPQLQLHVTNKLKLFTVCTEHAASGLPNPTHLEGEVRFVKAQDQQVVTNVVRK